VETKTRTRNCRVSRKCHIIKCLVYFIASRSFMLDSFIGARLSVDQFIHSFIQNLHFFDFHSTFESYKTFSIPHSQISLKTGPSSQFSSSVMQGYSPLYYLNVLYCCCCTYCYIDSFSQTKSQRNPSSSKKRNRKILDRDQTRRKSFFSSTIRIACAYSIVSRSCRSLHCLTRFQVGYQYSIFIHL
jgi:hypothetical protein